MDQHLRTLSQFLNSRGARERFMETCLDTPMEKAPFATWSTSFFSFKWTYATAFLQQAVPVLDMLLAKYDACKISRGAIPAQAKSGELSTPIGAALLADMTAAMAVPHLKFKLSVLLMLSSALDREVGWLEGCRCHAYLLSEGPGTPADRRRRFERATKQCMWKGCRQSEMIAGEAERMLARLRSSTDRRVSMLYSRGTDADRVQLKYQEVTFKDLACRSCSCR